jgi:hypothetical protein
MKQNMTLIFLLKADLSLYCSPLLLCIAVVLLHAVHRAHHLDTASPQVGRLPLVCVRHTAAPTRTAYGRNAALIVDLRSNACTSFFPHLQQRPEGQA